MNIEQFELETIPPTLNIIEILFSFNDNCVHQLCERMTERKDKHEFQ